MLIWRLMFRANCTYLNSLILSQWRCNMKLRNSNSAVITIKKVEKTWKLRRQFAKLLKESFVCRKVKIASTWLSSLIVPTYLFTVGLIFHLPIFEKPKGLRNTMFHYCSDVLTKYKRNTIPWNSILCSNGNSSSSSLTQFNKLDWDLTAPQSHSVCKCCVWLLLLLSCA